MSGERAFRRREKRANMDDQLILTDIFDNEIGTMSKSEAHRLGRLHRAFSVFIVSGGKMLIQKRHPGKYHSGGLWANACCSHPRSGEALADAGERRTQEELGATCPLKELFSFVYFSKYADDLFEYEFDHVFLGEYGGALSPDPEEIEELSWVGFDELEQLLVTEPQRFSTWFLIAAPKVLALLKQEAAL